MKPALIAHPFQHATLFELLKPWIEITLLMWLPVVGFLCYSFRRRAR